jgi:hypothetical protein
VVVKEAKPPLKVTLWLPASPVPYVGAAPFGAVPRPLIVAEPLNPERRFPALSTASTVTGKPTPARYPPADGTHVDAELELESTKRKEHEPPTAVDGSE